MGSPGKRRRGLAGPSRHRSFRRGDTFGRFWTNQCRNRMPRRAVLAGHGKSARQPKIVNASQSTTLLDQKIDQANDAQPSTACGFATASTVRHHFFSATLRRTCVDLRCLCRPPLGFPLQRPKAFEGLEGFGGDGARVDTAADAIEARPVVDGYLLDPVTGDVRPDQQFGIEQRRHILRGVERPQQLFASANAKTVVYVAIFKSEQTARDQGEGARYDTAL